MNATLQAALQWLERKTCVIPCRPLTKKAAVKWEKYQQKLPTVAQVTRWFTNNKHRNLALLCGPASGSLVVIDFDSVASWAEWNTQHNINTLTIRTPRPGIHVYLHLKELPPQSVVVNGTLVKCTGYILCPPSRHPSGLLYRVWHNAPIATVADLSVAMASYGRGSGSAPQRTSVHLSASPPIRSHGTHLYRGIISDVQETLPVLTLANRYTTMNSSDGGKGRWWMGCCPSPQHVDRNPSFRVDARYNQATCLSPTCALYEPKGMDVINLYSQLHGFSNRDAIRALAMELELVW